MIVPWEGLSCLVTMFDVFFLKCRDDRRAIYLRDDRKNQGREVMGTFF